MWRGGSGVGSLKRSQVLIPLLQSLLPVGLEMRREAGKALCVSWYSLQLMIPLHLHSPGLRREEGVWGDVREKRQLPSLIVLSPCQVTMAELQEVQITEEKPLLPGQTPEAAKVTGDPLTSLPRTQTSGHLSCLLASQAYSSHSNAHPAFYTSMRLPSILQMGAQTFVLSRH